MKRVRTPADFKKAREALGLTQEELARMARHPDPDKEGRQMIRRYEQGSGKKGLPGFVQIAMEAILAGFRPTGWKEKK